MNAYRFQANPETYRHWELRFEGPIARLRMKVKEDGGLRDDYKLKLNSYDLGVDIELADAVNRLRFEHPEVSVISLESALEGVFCAGANIFMLGTSSHSHKVNFCKFTNETRLSMEDATSYSGQTYVASVTGICAGGGYELALACKEIHLVHDRKSAVSLPETPYLAVLPGTGGLTRLTDKRKMRRDRADIFCTLAEGIKGEKAVEWGLVDFLHPSSSYREKYEGRLKELAGKGYANRGVHLDPVTAKESGTKFEYKYVTLDVNPERRTARLVVKGPSDGDLSIPSDPTERKSDWYALRFWRELDDAILNLRFNFETVGVVTIESEGDPKRVTALDDALLARKDHWFVREILLLQKRVLKRLDVTARSIFTLVKPGSCFAGSFLEIALTADRIYMLADAAKKNAVMIGSLNEGFFTMPHGLSRLQNRFYGEPESLRSALASKGKILSAEEAMKMGLVTSAPDDLDWDDEVRMAIEERVSLSPDALTGMEANLRFSGPETMESRIFGRLSAWQNWIFTRPNATGETGALTSYGKPTKAKFDWRRT